MLREEILKLHERLDIRDKSRDTSIDDNHIAQMADTLGWEVLKGMMESMIAELLRPVDFEDNTPLDVRGAIGEARLFGIEVLQKVISQVESTKAAKKSEKADMVESQNKESAT